jgi:hypothetical protein
MRTKYFLFFWLFIFVLCSNAISQTFADFVLISPPDKVIPLEVESLTGIKDQPLANTKMRLDDKYGKDFFLLYKVIIAAGTQVIGKYKLTKDPPSDNSL